MIPPAIRQEGIAILQAIRHKITDDSDLIWTPFEHASEIRSEIDSMISAFERSDRTAIEERYVHFLPTSTFQEHSLQNNWNDEYHVLAKRFDLVMAHLK